MLYTNLSILKDKMTIGYLPLLSPPISEECNITITDNVTKENLIIEDVAIETSGLVYQLRLPQISSIVEDFFSKSRECTVTLNDTLRTAFLLQIGDFTTNNRVYNTEYNIDTYELF